jgi:hypothetical protein
MRALLDAIETRLLRRPGWPHAPAAPPILVFDTGFAVRGLVVPWWDKLDGPGARRQDLTLFERTVI